jgi:hypothetical protein
MASSQARAIPARAAAPPRAGEPGGSSPRVPDFVEIPGVVRIGCLDHRQQDIRVDREHQRFRRPRRRAPRAADSSAAAMSCSVSSGTRIPPLRRLLGTSIKVVGELNLGLNHAGISTSLEDGSKMLADLPSARLFLTMRGLGDEVYGGCLDGERVDTSKFYFQVQAIHLVTQDSQGLLL